MRRSAAALLSLVLVAAFATAVLRLRGPDDGSGSSSTAAKLSRGPRVPDLVGRTRTQAICQVRGHQTRLVVDGFEEHPDRRTFVGICNGSASVLPDPPVERQSPAPGSPLEADTIIRLSTPCIRTGCL